MEINWGEIIGLILQFSPAIAYKILEWMKRYQSGPFKALHFPGWRGKLAKGALSIVLSTAIAALAQYLAAKVGVDGPTLVSGAGTGVAATLAYGAARQKMPK